MASDFPVGFVKESVGLAAWPGKERRACKGKE